MSKFIEIQKAILSLSPGEYQRFCSAYIFKKHDFTNMHDTGSKEGTNKTTIGIPDSYYVDENGKYTLVMYGTVEKQSIAKLKKDICEASDGSKTGITQEKIKEIICFHTNTNINPGEYDSLVNLIPNKKITLIDIDSMSHDIDENYRYLANDYLNILIDTNQISDINTFIERYDKVSINSPLNVDFVYRKEKDSIYQNIKEAKMTIITGKPGNGKTRISLEVMKELEQKEKYIPLCVRVNGLQLYEDLKTAIKNDKKYIIFFDDINNLNGLQSIIDLIITNKNENIKILATARGYMLDEILKKVTPFIEPNIFVLNEMQDSEIINILENTYNVKNQKWQQKILRISNRNPRLAIMSFLAVKEGKIDSLNSVYDVFKTYYETILEQKSLSEIQINILFYISLLSPISSSNKIVNKTFSDLGILDINEFKNLRDMELIDYFNEDALKICDQNFANYLLYKYLIIDKTIKISELLKLIYPNFINKFINVINMIREQFYDEEICNYITEEIDVVWKEEPYNSDWRFLEYFHNVNVSKALMKIKKKIEDCPEGKIPEEIKHIDNVYISDDLLRIISDFKDTEYFKISFELLLKYLEKTPNLYNEVCKSIKDYWLMKNPQVDFSLEKEIISKLFSKYKTTTINKIKEIYKILLKESLMYCLELEYHFSKQGMSPRNIELITFRLQESDLVLSFREYIYDIVFELCNEDENNYNLLLKDSIWFYDDEQKGILKNDVRYLDINFFSKFKKVSITQSKILFLLKSKCQRFEIEVPVSLEKYNECSEFLIINMFEQYDYEDKNDTLINWLEKQDKYYYRTIFVTLKNIEEQKMSFDAWKISRSVDILFEYALDKDIKLFEYIFFLYLELECPYVNGARFIRNLADKTIIERILDNIIKSNVSIKYYLLSVMLNNYCDEKYLLIVENFIRNQKNMEKKYTLSIEAILEYNKFDDALLENYTNEILIENKVELYSSYTNLFIDEVFVQIVYNAFSNKETLEKLYINSINCHNDYEGALGTLLCINNYDVLNKILATETYDYIWKIKNIIKNIWSHIKYKEIISYNYDKIMDLSFGYLKAHILFDCDSDENIKSNQIEWFKDKIVDIKEDKEKIYYLFNVIAEKEDSFKKELIIFLMENTNNIEIFKNINFFSHSEIWSESRIPNIEKKIEFIQTILDEIKGKNNLMHIEYIEYLNNIIQDYKKEIRETQIKEYTDDFLN